MSDFVCPFPQETSDRTAHIYEFTDDGEHIDLALTIDGRCNCPEHEHKPLHPWERGLVNDFRRLLGFEPLASPEGEWIILRRFCFLLDKVANCVLAQCGPSHNRTSEPRWTKRWDSESMIENCNLEWLLSVLMNRNTPTNLNRGAKSINFDTTRLTTLHRCILV